MTVCFPGWEAASSATSAVIVCLLSFLVVVTGLSLPSVVDRGSSPDRRIRMGSFIRDFFCVALPVSTVVGAVVMMAGAACTCSVSKLGSKRRKQPTLWHRRGPLLLLLLLLLLLHSCREL